MKVKDIKKRFEKKIHTGWDSTVKMIPITIHKSHFGLANESLLTHKIICEKLGFEIYEESYIINRYLMHDPKKSKDGLVYACNINFCAERMPYRTTLEDNIKRLRDRFEYKDTDVLEDFYIVRGDMIYFLEIVEGYLSSEYTPKSLGEAYWHDRQSVHKGFMQGKHVLDILHTFSLSNQLEESLMSVDYMQNILRVYDFEPINELCKDLGALEELSKTFDIIYDGDDITLDYSIWCSEDVEEFLCALAKIVEKYKHINFR